MAQRLSRSLNSYDETKKAAAKFASQHGLYLERGSRSIPSVEAMKTIAFEIAEQLTWKNDDTLPNHVIFQTPDWYIQAVSGGLGPLGVQKGFYELFQMGLVEKTPAMAIIQVEGCAPMVHAWKSNQKSAEPIHAPKTRISTLATGDPGRTYNLLRQQMIEKKQGVFESVVDEEAFRAMHLLARLEGISVEPAAAVAFAGLIKLVHSGTIKHSDTVVINCSGHTLPVEKAVLDQSSQNLFKSDQPVSIW